MGEALTPDRLIEATVELLDEVGVAGFSMRTLAARLGLSQMAAYRHVANREELLILAGLHVESDVPTPHPGPWYAQLEEVIRSTWETTWSAHPWVAELILAGHLPPRSSGRLDLMRGIYRAGGFDGERLASALIAHWSFVVGTLTVIQTMQASGAAGYEAFFDFNLDAYIAGVRALAERGP